MGIDYASYKWLGCWAAGEAACLLVGVPPDEYKELLTAELNSWEPREIDFLSAYSSGHERQLQQEKALCQMRQNKISEIGARILPIMECLESDLLVGAIAAVSTKNGTNYFLPSVFVRWAASKGFYISSELAELAEQTAALAVQGVSQSKGERDLTKWFREIWEKEGRPTGTPLFDALKKYVNQPDSPIREHYMTSPNGAGIRWNTGTATGNMTKKNIQTMASKFKKEESKKAVNS